jgi:hypothetical protein
MTTLGKTYGEKSLVLLGKSLGTHWEHQNTKKSNPTALPKRKNYKPLGVNVGLPHGQNFYS